MSVIFSSNHEVGELTRIGLKFKWLLDRATLFAVVEYAHFQFVSKFFNRKASVSLPSGESSKIRIYLKDVLSVVLMFPKTVQELSISWNRLASLICVLYFQSMIYRIIAMENVSFKSLIIIVSQHMNPLYNEWLQ